MFCIKLIPIALLTINIFGINAELDVFLEDAYIEHFDPYYIKDADAWISDEGSNRNIVVNFTLVKSLPEQTEGHLLLMGASMGEYVVPSGIDFRMSICEMIDEPIMIGPFLTALGFREDQCPPELGVYGTNGYTLPTEAFPPEFPQNKYKATFDMMDQNKLIVSVAFLVEIQ